MNHSSLLHTINVLVILVLSVLFIGACDGNDMASNGTSIETPVEVSKLPSSRPVSVSNPVPLGTMVPIVMSSPETPTEIMEGFSNVNVSAFLDRMDEAIREEYTSQNKLDIYVFATLEDQQRKFTVSLTGVSKGKDYDAQLSVDETIPMDVRRIGNRIFVREPNLADRWRELSLGQNVINTPELIMAVRDLMKESTVVGVETMGGVTTHHMSGVIDGSRVGDVIGVLMGTEGDLKFDLWNETETGRVVRLTMKGQTSGKEQSNLVMDIDVDFSAWDFGTQVDVLVPPLPPSPSNQQWDVQPEMTLETDRDYKAVIVVYEKGEIVVDLYEKLSPVTVNNFVFLSESGFYDWVSFHRVIPDFMAQTGDPTGTGSGGPGYKFQNEFHPDARHDGAGILSMANSGVRDGKATNGSQFFITYRDTSFLDGLNADTSPKDCSAQGISCHSVFGRVISGMDVVEAIQPRDPSVGGYADIIESIAIIIE